MISFLEKDTVLVLMPEGFILTGSRTGSSRKVLVIHYREAINIYVVASGDVVVDQKRREGLIRKQKIYLSRYFESPSSIARDIIDGYRLSQRLNIPNIRY